MINYFDTIVLKTPLLSDLSFQEKGIKFNAKNYTLTISSKLINGELICHENIGNVEERIQGYIDLTTLLSNLTVLSAHSTKDIYSEQTELLNNISLFPFKNLSLKTYIKRGGDIESLVYTSKQTKKKTHSTYLTIYNKFIESRDERFRSVFRIELKHNTFQGLRQKFDVKKSGEVKLFELLNASVNPLSDIFLKQYLTINDTMNKPTLLKKEIDKIKSKLYYESKSWDWNEIRTELELRSCSYYQIKKEYDTFLQLQAEEKELNYENILLPLFNGHFKASAKRKTEQSNQSNARQTAEAQ